MSKTYEYLAIDIRDKWGKIDPEVITNKLNELGVKGWHLVTAYSNELGKNAIKAANIHINATADQNIFIFEREIINKEDSETKCKDKEIYELNILNEKIKNDLNNEKDEKKKRILNNLLTLTDYDTKIFIYNDGKLRTYDEVEEFNNSDEITKFIKINNLPTIEEFTKLSHEDKTEIRLIIDELLSTEINVKKKEIIYKTLVSYGYSWYGHYIRN